MMSDPPATLAWLEAQADTDLHYEFTLFVSGASDLAGRAVANARHLFETYLPGRYQLSVIDVQDNVTALVTSGVLATPTLVRNTPGPERRVVGDLSSSGRVLLALGVPHSAVPPEIAAG